MYQVIKRDNRIADFDISKISNAITLAFDACDRQSAPSVIDFLALKVTADFEPKIKDGLIAVEDIQDSVETVLIQGGYSDVANHIPNSRAALSEAEEMILIPYGATKLRLTEMPVASKKQG